MTDLTLFLLLLGTAGRVTPIVCSLIDPDTDHGPDFELHRFPWSLVYGRRCHECKDPLPPARSVR